MMVGPNGPEPPVVNSQEQHSKAGGDNNEEERARARIPLLHGKVYAPPDEKTFVKHILHLMMVAALPSLLLLSMWFFFSQVSTTTETETQPGPHSTLPSSRGSACDLSPNCKSFNILSFNVWGIPESFGAKYKDERILGLALELAKGQYDIVVLEELWMEADHRMLEDALLDANYTMTRFRQLSVSECDGRISPLLCSGLAVATKMRFSQDDVQFTSFGDHGNGLKAFVDGEVLAKKGIGRVRIPILDGSLTLDILATHTAADPDQDEQDYNNIYYRKKQIKQILDDLVDTSDADVVILAGDLNSTPYGPASQLVGSRMNNTAREIFPNTWNTTAFATLGNGRNSFPSHTGPVIFDYIFYKIMKEDKVSVEVVDFASPQLKTTVLDDDTEELRVISLSDHEPVAAKFDVWKKEVP